MTERLIWTTKFLFIVILLENTTPCSANHLEATRYHASMSESHPLTSVSSGGKGATNPEPLCYPAQAPPKLRSEQFLSSSLRRDGNLFCGSFQRRQIPRLFHPKINMSLALIPCTILCTYLTDNVVQHIPTALVVMPGTSGSCGLTATSFRGCPTAFPSSEA